MKHILATTILALAAVAGHAATDSPEGIAYTSTVTVNAHYRAASGNRYSNLGPYHAQIELSVAALGTGTYSASLHCPAGVTGRSSETLARTNTATSTGTTFDIQVAGQSQIGFVGETWRCWLQVRVTRATADAEDVDVVRDVMLPVDVTHIRLLNTVA